MPPEGTALNPFFRAVSRFRQRRWDECVDICTELLEQSLGKEFSDSPVLRSERWACPRNPKDQAAWFLKCRALTSKQWIDDVEPPGRGRF